MSDSNWRAHLRPDDAHPPVGITPELRRAVRCLLIDDHKRLLLQQIANPADGLLFWIVPGGGIEPEESDIDALRREVREETGIKEVALGPPVWTRQHVFSFKGRWYHQQETFYLGGYVDQQHEPPELEDLEIGIILGHRWWTLAELEATSDGIAPAGLPKGLRSILHGSGPPAHPYDIGI